VVTFPDDLGQFWGVILEVWRGRPPLKTSGIGHLLFVGLYWAFCKRL